MEDLKPFVSALLFLLLLLHFLPFLLLSLPLPSFSPFLPISHFLCLSPLFLSFFAMEGLYLRETVKTTLQ
jgi:hypothetical protein